MDKNQLGWKLAFLRSEKETLDDDILETLDDLYNIVKCTTCSTGIITQECFDMCDDCLCVFDTIL